MPGMKRKTIKRVIETKLDTWLNTIPPELRAKVEGHLIVTGGCIASMLLGETVNDFDIYCDDADMVSLLAQYYVNVFNEKPRIRTPFVKHSRDENGNVSRVAIYVQSDGVIGEDIRENSLENSLAREEDTIAFVQQDTANNQQFRPVFLSENAVTLSDKIQIVIRFFGNPDEIHKNYDYIHATNYYYSKTKELVLRTSALESLLSKSLNYQGSLYPICSLFRMRKFLDRGWTISAGEITKMAMQISELNLKDADVLHEQLTGIDSLYFHQLIRMINDWKNNNPEQDIDSSYVIELINTLSDNNIL